MGVIRRYRNARSKWFAAGQPTRTDDEVKEIFETQCKPCEHYRRVTEEVGQCKKCKCALNLGKRLNKLRWATEQCPADEPKWYAQVIQTKDGVWTKVTEPESAKHASLETAPASTREQRIEKRRIRRERQVARQAKSDAKKAKSDTLDTTSDKAVRLGPIPPIVPYERTKDSLIVYDRDGVKTDALRGHWTMYPVFIVCGGPSLNTLDLSLLENPAVCSIGVNNAAAYAPCKAAVFSDPIEKFHHGIFLNPNIMTFCPPKKLKQRVRAKENGKFHYTAYVAKQFPNVWGYDRVSELGTETWDPSQFFTVPHATWGISEKAGKKLGRQSVRFTPLLAIRLAHYLGARRVYLLGVDLDMRPGLTGGYAWDQARTVGAAASNNAHYRRITTMFHELKPVFDKQGFEVYTCNPNTKLSVFGYVPYEDAIADAVKLMPSKPYDLSQWYEKDIRKDPMEEK